MVDIIPFKGLFYNKIIAGDISKLISPPYDVISASLKKELYGSHPYNIINLILPEGSAGEKYGNAKKILSDWTRQNILEFDRNRCFYIFEESYNISGRIKKISGFIGLTRLEPYSKLQIIPHEKTSSRIKKDRLKLLSECRTDFGLVFTLYNDNRNRIKNILKSNIQKNPIINTKAGYDPTLRFKIWKITDTGEIDRIISIMKNKKLIIADGHHRYETAIKYRDEYKKKPKHKKENEKSYPEDFILTLYINILQNDFLILPTYRLLKFNNYPGMEKVLDRLSDTFNIKEDILKSSDYIREKLLKSKSRGLKRFFLYDEDKKLYSITLKSKYINKTIYKNTIDRDYSNMDINILHKFFMERISEWYEVRKIDYTHSIDDVIKNINCKKFDIGVFLNAPTVKELEKICTAGYLMPEKSTYFYPKPCSGLVMYKLDYDSIYASRL